MLLLRCCSCFIAFPFVWSFANHFRLRELLLPLLRWLVAPTSNHLCVYTAGCTFCDYIRVLLHCMVRISIFSDTLPQVARKQSSRFHQQRLQVRIDSLFGWCCSMKIFLCLETKPDSAPHTTDVVCLRSIFKTTESHPGALTFCSRTCQSSCNRSSTCEDPLPDYHSDSPGPTGNVSFWSNVIHFSTNPLLARP